MKSICRSRPAALLLVLLTLTLAQFSASAQISSVPPVMNFQGRLARPDGTPVPDGSYSVRFSLWTAASAGTERWNLTQNVLVRNGTFASLLTGLSTALFRSSLFLEIKVGAAAALTPRQPLASLAYAFKADSVRDGSITGASIADATITANKFASNVLNATAWLLGGNSGTTGSQFLGTKDNKPLQMRVNNHRAMQFTYFEDTSDPGNEFRTLNVLGGSEINSIAPGVFGATIAGGGLDYFTGTDYPNTVTNDFGTVGGGDSNTASGFAATVGGGDSNTASDIDAFVGGGNNNTASLAAATVAGGADNTANNLFATVAGGKFNTAGGFAATVGGGDSNTASGDYATVPGGIDNIAAGPFSFAAGDSAHAFHSGAFVWADNQNASFDSTAPNQFLIRAGGGVKLSPETTLEFGFGVAGKEGNAGKIGYATFTPDALDIVGAGAADAPRKVKIWAEGGTTFAGDINVNGINYTSDARFKTNIATVDNALDTILNLRGVTFDWNRERWKERGFAAGRQIGFIAQEVEQVLPELVSTGEKGYKSVAYVNVVPVLVEAMKQQQKQIDDLKPVKAENAELKARNATLEARLAAIESALAELKTQQQVAYPTVRNTTP